MISVNSSIPPNSVFLGTGRRKNAIARVRIVESGSGQITINKNTIKNYCSTEEMLRATVAPLHTVGLHEKVDVMISVYGGGTSGQAGAMAHGLARALEKMNSEFRPLLKKAGHIKRDPRMKERKKSGRPGARKRFQFSKR